MNVAVIVRREDDAGSERRLSVYKRESPRPACKVGWFGCWTCAEAEPRVQDTYMEALAMEQPYISAVDEAKVRVVYVH